MAQHTRYVVAAAQLDVQLGEKALNLGKSVSSLHEAAKHGAQLAVFPECTLTGYVYKDLEELLPCAEVIPGPTTERLARAANETGTYLVFGMVERDGDSAYNASVLVGPEEGLICTYRKAHLPHLGLDRLILPGDRPFQVCDIKLGSAAMLICYDLRFPEAARSLALQGADLIALPTNWPIGATGAADFLVRARAYESRVFVIACDRVGVERGVTFLGRSQIVDPSGKVLAEASSGHEEIIYAEVDLAIAREKRVMLGGGGWTDVLRDRRPQMYGELVRTTGNPDRHFVSLSQYG